MKKLAIVGVCAVLVAWPGASFAAVYQGSHLVKESGDYIVYPTDGNSWMWNCDCDAAYLGNAPSDLNISPASGDPDHVTANPLSIAACAVYDSTGDGLLDFNFQGYFASLRDLGDWEIVCECWDVDPYYCWSDGGNACGYTCDLDYVLAGELQVFQMDIYNSLPTANISHSPTPAWNATLTFDANGDDPDHPGGSGLEYTWSVTTKPSGAVSFSDANSASPTLDMNDDANIGHWVVKLDLDDQEGERVTVTESFDVPNIPPNISVDGASEIDALETIQVDATPTSDPDGGSLSFSWDIVTSPSGSSHPPADNVGTAANFPTYTTNEDDIGAWTVRVTATDNEGASADPPGEDTETFDFVVLNLPPRIELVGETEISVGDTIDIATDVLDDDDGGSLTFVWDIIQSPDSSGIGPQSGFSEDSSLYLPALTVSMAGTWIFRLTATDNEGPNADPPGVTSEDISVLVDGPPTAVITVTAGAVTLVGDPPTMGANDFPLIFDASDSEDPDSPCVGVAGRCHSTSDPPVKDISPAITTYQWALIDVPSELYGIQPLGRVDEVLGINGSSATLSFNSYATLGASGQFTFQVTVWDGEDNEATAIQSVMIIDPNTEPTAVVSPPIAYMTVNGALTADIPLSGMWSFDLDNTLLDQPLGNGLGIESYTWTLIPPSFCSPPVAPAIASWTLFSAGTVIPPECQGIWTVQLTVGDDDNPQLVGSADTFVVIRNCANPLCIDAPTTAQPTLVEFTDKTDVTILYHLDATIYNHPEFNAGAFTQLAIFHESDTQNPFYVDYDFNVLVNDQGGYNTFNWNGVGTGSYLPDPGNYHVTVTLLDAGFTPSAYTATELDSIIIAVADISIRDTSDTFVSYDDLDDGSDTLDIDYDVMGVGSVDEIDWYVYDAADTLRASDILPGSLSGTINWDGQDFGVTIDPGVYTFVVEAKRQGASLGVSAPHSFVVYSLGIKPHDGPAPPQGMPVFANIDDDDWSNAADHTQTPAPVAEDDLVRVDIELEPFDVQGEVTLSATGVAFKVFTNANKTNELVLPHTFALANEAVPSDIYIEGVAPGAAELRIELTPPGSVATPQRVLAMNIVAVETVLDGNNDHAITAADTAAFWTRIARWDNAYDVAFNVLNGADPGNLVEQDPSRFYIRVTDVKANTDPGAVETRQVHIGTLDAAKAPNDPAVQSLLIETGPNTGVFVSRSHMLMAADVTPSDDGFAVDDGFGTAIADNANNDRTHRADIDGSVRTSYQPVGAAAARTTDVPICQRNPESRRYIEVSIHVFNEPFLDNGFDDDGNAATPVVGANNNTFDFTDSNANGEHDAGEPSEPYIDMSHGNAGSVMARGDAPGVVDGRGPVASDQHVLDELARTDLSWAQTCMHIEQKGVTAFEDAPLVGGVDLLADNDTSFPAPDAQAIFDTYSAGMTTDVVEVFYVGPTSGALGVSWRPGNQTVAHGEKVFLIVRSNTPIANRTLAHELGHVVLNSPDSPSPQTVFFPAQAAVLDTALNQFRRLSAASETTARTVRPLGNQNAPGNSFMKTP